MGYDIRYLPLALDDAKEIKKYLSQFYPSTPQNFFAELKRRIELLSETPEMCEVYPDYPDYRKMVVGENYLVFYKIRGKEKVVEIHRILHGARKIQDFLDTEAH